MTQEEFFTKDYSYDLQQERIATYPLEQRDASKLLVYQKGEIREDVFKNLSSHLPENCLLVMNDTKVTEARIMFQKETGAIIEIFCLEPFEQSMEVSLRQLKTVQWKCLVGGASKWKHGQILQKKIQLHNKELLLTAAYIQKLDDGFVIEFSWDLPDICFIDVLHSAGAIPLPPYIKRPAEQSDSQRYQTIFGKHDGSVAAPTAALHFTESVFENLKKKNISKEFITLNVGAGTFKPVKSERITDHQMHGGDFTITKEAIKKIIDAEKIVAVGTTSLRTLESIYWLGVKLLSNSLHEEWSLSQWEAYELKDTFTYQESLQAIVERMNTNFKQEVHCRTSLLIRPGYQFKIPHGLITNFHQPQSTLLFLVAAFIGNDWKKVYQYALENKYRFLSYGDSSLLWRD